MARLSAAAYCFVAMPFMPATVARVMRTDRARAAAWVLVLVMMGSWACLGFDLFGSAFRVPMDELSELRATRPTGLRRLASKAARAAIARDGPLRIGVRHRLRDWNFSERRRPLPDPSEGR